MNPTRLMVSAGAVALISGVLVGLAWGPLGRVGPYPGSLAKGLWKTSLVLQDHGVVRLARWMQEASERAEQNYLTHAIARGQVLCLSMVAPAGMGPRELIGTVRTGLTAAGFDGEMGRLADEANGRLRLDFYVVPSEIVAMKKLGTDLGMEVRVRQPGVAERGDGG